MRQATLFDFIPPNTSATIGLAGVMPAVRAAMNRVAAEYEPGRKVLVDALAAAARREGVPLTAGGGKQIKDDQLDKILQPKAGGHNPTLDFVLCFCLATNDFSPLEPIWKAFGLKLIPASDVPYLEYGKTCDALKKAREAKRKLEAGL